MKNWLVAVFILLATSTGSAQSENRFKALLVYKISEYVVWPDDQQPIIVGVAGDSEMYKTLLAFSQKRDHIKVIQVNNPEEVKNCHMVYVPTAKSELMPHYRMHIASSSILVLSEDKGLIKKGADITIFTENNRLKYVVNEGTIKGKGMVASGKLLSLGNSM